MVTIELLMNVLLRTANVPDCIIAMSKEVNMPVVPRTGEFIITTSGVPDKILSLTHCPAINDVPQAIDVELEPFVFESDEEELLIDCVREYKNDGWNVCAQIPINHRLYARLKAD